MTPEQYENARLKIAAQGRYDPLLFTERAWPWGQPGTSLEHEDIRVWQAEVLDEIAQHLQNPETRFRPLRIAVASGHGAGKSAGMGMITTWALSCFKDPRIVITANTEGQLVTKTSPEVGQWVRTSMFGDLFDTSAMSIKMQSRPDQHRVDFVTWSETRTEAFAGLHAKGRIVLLLMDEASAIPDKIWEVAEGAMTDEDTVLVWIAFGNPTMNTGRFRECFRRYRKHWVTKQIDSRDVEGTNKPALELIIQTYGEHHDVSKIRVKGQFPSASSYQFISSSDVDRAFGRHYDKHQYDFAPVIIGVDPAWTGDDEFVITKRQGLMSQVLKVMAKNDNDWFAAQVIKNLEDEHQADAVFIDGGFGTGIYSAGKTMDRDWKLIWFSGASPDPGYLNMRAWMWGQMRDWIKAGGSIPDDQRFYEELISVDVKPHPAGIIQLRAKEEMKKDLLPSPNKADSLALTFAAPVTKKDRSAAAQSPRTRITRRQEAGQYDPYGDL